MTSIHIIYKEDDKNEFAETIHANNWFVGYYCDCVDHYPNSGKEGITVIDGKFEGTRELEIVWLNSCRCPINCDTRANMGDYVYLLNKFWKIIGRRVYDDCGCQDIKLTLERLTPRETSKSMLECIDCFAPQPR